MSIYELSKDYYKDSIAEYFSDPRNQDDLLWMQMANEDPEFHLELSDDDLMHILMTNLANK